MQQDTAFDNDLTMDSSSREAGDVLTEIPRHGGLHHPYYRVA